MELITDLEGDTASIAIDRLIQQTGLLAPTSRAIAAEANLSPSTLTKWFGSREAMLERAAQPSAARSARRLDEFIGKGWLEHAHLVPGFHYEGDLSRIRVRLAWAELARCHPGVAAVFERLVADERASLRGMLPPTTPDTAVIALHALLIGLWEGVCAEPPLDGEQAFTIWSTAVDEFNDRFREEGSETAESTDVA